MTDDRPAWHSYRNNKLWKSTTYVHPGWREAEHEQGVVMLAPWEEPFSGFPDHARRLARSLAWSGVPLRLRSIRGSRNPAGGTRDLDLWRARQAVREEFADLVRASIKHKVAEVVMTIADEEAIMRFAPPVHHWMEPEQHRYALSRRVLSTVFERDRVGPQARAALGRLGQVWVANESDRRMLLEMGLAEDRVWTIPIPYLPDEPLLRLRPRKRMPGVPRFYHIGKWEPRKEQRNIIGAFLLAFSPGEASLYLKTSLQGAPGVRDYPKSAHEALWQWLDDGRVKANGWTADNVNRGVFVIARRLTDGQIRDLHRQSDVYVTLSRGEGFDMPAYDAKLAANLMVYTPSGGPQDFAGDDDILVCPNGSVPCHPFYGWGDDARYLDYDLDEATAALRSAYDLVMQGGRVVPPEVTVSFQERFGAMAVGNKMRQALEQLVDETPAWAGVEGGDDADNDYGNGIGGG